MEHYIFRWFRLQASNEARLDQEDSKGICRGETDKEQLASGKHTKAIENGHRNSGFIY